jgi:uncharacterized OB-fold protein
MTADDPVFAPDTAFVQLAPDVHTAPFWAAANEHRLAAPRCQACAKFVLPPTGWCPTCRSRDMEWVTLSGRARLYTYTIVRHAPVPAISGTVPYVLAVVKLPDAGDVKLITNVVDCDSADLAIGQELEVVWHARGDGVTIPRFRPVGVSQSGVQVKGSR